MSYPQQFFVWTCDRCDRKTRSSGNIGDQLPKNWRIVTVGVYIEDSKLARETGKRHPAPCFAGTVCPRCVKILRTKAMELKRRWVP